MSGRQLVAGPPGGVEGRHIYVPAPMTASFVAVDGAIVVGLTPLVVRRLNQTGSLVWQVLGEDLTVDQLARELADAFGSTEGEMRSSVTPLLTSLASEGLLVEVSEQPLSPPLPPAVEVDGPVRLTIPPCGCVVTVDDFDWAAMAPLQVGNEIFGLRTNDLGAHQLLVEAFDGHVVDDPLAQGYYSVQVFAEPTDQTPLRLWQGNTSACATRSTAVLWERAHAAVSQHLRPEPGLLRLLMVAVIGPRGASLVPSYAAERLYEERDRLAEAGIFVADGPVEIDPETGELHVRAGVDVDADAARAFASLLPGRGLVAGAEPGVAKVVALPASSSEPGDHLARLHAVASLVIRDVADANALGADALLGAFEALASYPHAEPPDDLVDCIPWLIDVLR